MDRPKYMVPRPTTDLVRSLLTQETNKAECRHPTSATSQNSAFAAAGF